MAQLKVLARTVDLLGRQQIATVQNAFAELFKNAYDAGASSIRVDYLMHFCSDGSDLISIKDDGDGMTSNDFMDKWMVIGTDNKANIIDVSRKQTGEKGIGRLSIALLGNMVLVLSWSKKTGKFIASLIHWGIFQLDKLEIDDIDFPVVEFSGNAIPAQHDLEKLRTLLQKSLDVYQEKCANSNHSLLNSIRKDVQHFILDTSIVRKYLMRYSDQGETSEFKESPGTWFLIGNPSEMMRSAIADEHIEARNKRGNNFASMLLAFTDKVFTGRNSYFSTHFNIWRDNAFFPDSILSEDGFITREEMTNGMDYYVEGRVGADGVFDGMIKDAATVLKYIRIPPPANFNVTDCGPFEFRLGTLQWQKELSQVAKRSLIDYDVISGKMRSIGGIYIYRDGIRILPYGSSNAGDWLDVERFRIHSLGRYFLSRRNSIGAVLLSREGNPNLREKAGREGFQKNRAYKQVQDIVLNILSTLSREHFSIDKNELEIYQRRQDEMRRRRLAMRELERQNSAELRKFEQRMRQIINGSEAGLPNDEVQECLKTLAEKVKKAISDGYPVKFYLSTLQTLSEEVYSSIDKIRAKYSVEYPHGIAVPAHLQTMWQRCEEIIRRQDKEVFLSAKSIVAELMNQTMSPLEQLQKTGVLEQQFTKYMDAGYHLAKESAQKVKTLVNDFARRCDQIVNLSIEEVNNVRAQAVERWRKGVGDISPREFVNWQHEVFTSMANAMEASNALETLLRRILFLFAKSDSKATLDLLGSLQQAISDYEANAEEDFEMIQKGVAVSIVEHEFFATTSEIYLALRELDSLAKMAPAIKPMSERIRNSFAHLDSFIRVLEPLQKRIHGNEEEISGKKMFAYIRRAFGARFMREHVDVKRIDSFDDSAIKIAPAVLYPVLVNLVDNALYWLGTSTADRQMAFEFRAGEIVISNSGPRIEAEIADLIFTKGFSMKPGGRGLGLYIAKEVLRDSGFALRICTPCEGCNVAFGIGPKSVNEKDA